MVTVNEYILWGEHIKIVLDGIHEQSNKNWLNTQVNLQQTILHTPFVNPWFTLENTLQALYNVVEFLQEKSVQHYCTTYPPTQKPKKIALILAGNIPAVGFQDVLCVLLSGHHALIKCSSDDKQLIPALLAILIEIQPKAQNHFSVVPERLKDFDAVIATGSNNTARYFNYYFGKYPNIIRKARTSMAVIHGDESPEDWAALQLDVFSYFGLGCRSVNFLWIPATLDTTYLINNLSSAKTHALLHHHKYLNNIDYHKSILLLNRTPFLDAGSFLLLESPQLFSSIALLHFQKYHQIAEVDQFKTLHQESLQCIVDAKQQLGTLKPGTTQQPQLIDFPDNLDVGMFLGNLT